LHTSPGNNCAGSAFTRDITGGGTRGGAVSTVTA